MSKSSQLRTSLDEEHQSRLPAKKFSAEKFFAKPQRSVTSDAHIVFQFLVIVDPTLTIFVQALYQACLSPEHPYTPRQGHSSLQLAKTNALNF